MNEINPITIPKVFPSSFKGNLSWEQIDGDLVGQIHQIQLTQEKEESEAFEKWWPHVVGVLENQSRNIHFDVSHCA